MSASPVLEVEHLLKQYGRFTAVNDLSMKIKKGEFMGLLGPNGAGKSTTLKCITGLVKPTSGRILVNGVDSLDHKEAMAHVGCVIETPESYPNFTPVEMLEYIGKVHGLPREEIRIRARDVLEEVRMWSWRDKPVGQFSKGMRQRVSLAAAMLPNPEIILLDEPTSGLDPRGMIEIRQTLNDLKRRDLTLLISTHILKEVSEMCTSMTMINQGRTVVSGDVNTLIHDAAMGTKGVQIEIKTLTEIPHELSVDLSGAQGVSDFERTGDRSVRFTFVGTDEQQADLIDLVYKHNVRMTAMNETGADLESLYMQLTADTEVNVR